MPTLTFINPFGQSIETGELTDGSVTAAKLATDAAETAKIKDLNVTLAKLANTSITNAKMSASAAVDFSKLAALTSARLLVGSAGNVPTSTAVTGDVTISNSGVTAIGANKVLAGMLGNDAVGAAALGILSTKGDLVSYSTLPARLGVGSNDEVLTADSAQTTGLKWAAAGGKVSLIGSLKVSGNTGTGSEHSVGTIAIGSGDFDADDVMLIVLGFCDGATPMQVIVQFIQNSITHKVVEFSQSYPIRMGIFTVQQKYTNTAASSGGFYMGTGFLSEETQSSGHDADWLTSAFTLDIRMNVAGSGKEEVDVKVYKLKAS